MKFGKLFLICIALISFNTNAALVERLGGLAYYDTETDLTWLADANYAMTSGYSTYGDMNWSDANTWATGLEVSGITGWRLPGTVDVGNDGATYSNIYQGVDFGYNITSHSELSNMFYNVLGNTAYYDTNGNGPQTNFGLVNTGPFSNIQSGQYWSSTELAGYEEFSAWYFFMHAGNQYHDTKSYNFFAWAVHDGDVSAVPVPAAVWLFASGLIGLIGFAKRKKS